MASIIPNSQFSKIFNPQDDSISMAQKTKISSPMPMNQNPVIRNAGTFLEPIQPNQMSLSPMSQPTPEAQDDDSGRFLASLIAQGAAGFGTGMMGGSAADIQRSASTFQTMRDTQENQRRAKQLTDPNSEESKRKREVYKSLGFKVPNNLSATDLNDPTVLQTLKGNMEQSRLAAIPRGGIGVGKENKEDQKNIQSFKDATAENNKFLKQLDQYSNLVKKIPLTGGTYASGASTIESAKVLRGKLLLQLKNIEKTGALDAGMIAIADQILGTPDYTRDEVVDAKTNQLKNAIQDDIQTNAVKFGIIGTAEGEDGNLYYIDKNNNPVMKVQ